MAQLRDDDRIASGGLFFEEVRPQKARLSFKRFGGMGLRLFPRFSRGISEGQRLELRKELGFLGIDMTPEEYVSATWFSALLFAVFLPPVLVPAVAFMHPTPTALVAAVLAGPAAGLIVFRALRNYPGDRLTDYAIDVESELPNALRGLALEQTMNIPVQVSLRNLANEGSGAMSEEAGKILADITHGSSVKDGLLRSSERVRSDIYRRSMNQLASAIERGTPLKDILWSLAKELDVKSNVAMQEYQGKLEALSATYITTAAVVPGITGTILMVAGPSFMESSQAIPLAAGAFCFAFPGLNQLLLNAMKQGRARL